MVRLFAVISMLALTGCATGNMSQNYQASIERERTDERGQALRDDFNRMTNDAY